jgi:hypothetical protein
MNTTYNGTTYFTNNSGVPGGGIGWFNITGVDLDFQDRIVVDSWFRRTNDELERFSTPFLFIVYSATNSSVIGGLFEDTNAPTTPPGRALLGMIIVIIVTAATYSVSRMSEVAGFAAIVTIGFLGTPSVAIFPLLYSVITVIVASIVLLVRILRGG